MWATAAQLRSRQSAMMAGRAINGPNGGPSWVRTPDNTPGRSASSKSSTVPPAALDCQSLQRITTPTDREIESSAQRNAERPLTGTATSTISTAQTGVQASATSQACAAAAISSGRPPSRMEMTAPPDKPRNQPCRSFDQAP